MTIWTKPAVIVGLALAGLAASPLQADDDGMKPGNESATCQDAGVFGSGLINNICWGCMFPIIIAGQAIIGSSSDAPVDANTSAICTCEDNIGLPRVGVPMGMWEPVRLIELVREPGCMQTLTGMGLPAIDDREWGYDSGHRGPGQDLETGSSYYHHRFLTFPLMQILEMYSPVECPADGVMDIDIQSISEMDPTWSDDELAFFASPEASVVANPAAQAACTADSVAASVGSPIDSLWWCAGTWGSMYPMSGNTGQGGMPQNTSLLAARTLAMQHRRGFEYNTMDPDTMCERAQRDYTMPKTQYRMQMFHPVAQGDRAHDIGESTYRWGKGRTIPMSGEDSVYVLWRWTECCNVY